jgi:hypothetical protein
MRELAVEGVRRTWRTRVEDVDGSRALLVAPSRADGTPFTVAPDTPIGLSWATSGALQRAEGRVTGGDVDVVARWWVTLERLTRVQRRDAYRLRVARPVTLLVEGDQLSGVTSDLSEGGALVVVPAPVDAVAGQRARVRLTLAADEVLLLDAEVVRLGAERDGERSLGLRGRSCRCSASSGPRSSSTCAASATPRSPSSPSTSGSPRSPPAATSAVLEDEGLVAARTVNQGRGRPAARYQLTDGRGAAVPAPLRPLAAEVLDFLADQHGRDGLRAFLRWRLEREVAGLREAVTAEDLHDRLEQLADALSAPASRRR